MNEDGKHFEYDRPCEAWLIPFIHMDGVVEKQNKNVSAMRPEPDIFRKICKACLVF